ncbi:MAG: penicillin-binding transpeptidase domain-containing protein [Saprospiraceae bacterium]|nr:penicillin-binding transpeptidase domain-containing protein [Saprospiraceae bacterium]
MAKPKDRLSLSRRSSSTIDENRHLYTYLVIDVWNHDTDLRSAYKNSTVWFYVNLAKRIGRRKYKHYFRKCKYGNRDLSEQGIDFWNYGTFAVSPKNQIKFLINLYEQRLPFSDEILAKVKSIMISEKTDSYTIRSKTGWTNKDGRDIGWWIGYVEKQANVFFFATRLTKDKQHNNPDFSRCRKEITKEIFAELGIL